MDLRFTEIDGLVNGRNQETLADAGVLLRLAVATFLNSLGTHARRVDLLHGWRLRRLLAARQLHELL